MSTVTTKDGTTIYYKDWGPKNAPPIVFHHGWPLTADDWDTQMLYFVEQGYRVVAHDRRGHGRSSQVSDGHDMDHYAADAAAVVTHLDLHDAVHIGHSTGGGEATHYVARHGKGRVAKLALIGAVPPMMLKTPANPGGLPLEVFDGLRQQLAANRAQFYRDLASGPFYSYNRPGAKVSQGVIENWWRQGMMGAAKAHYDGIKAFSETDFTEDLKLIDVPTFVMHGDDDQIVPIADSALLSAKLLKKGTLKVYEKFPHGMCTTHADVINADLLAFIKGILGANGIGGRTMKIVVMGGSGLVGTKVGKRLTEQGHEVLAASPNTGVDATTGRGVADALGGAEVVVDVSNSPSFEDAAALAFFQSAGRNLARAEKDAGVRHHVGLSVVGTERLQESGYFRAKLAQEQLIKTSGIPYTIVRATQFFEFLGAIATAGTDDRRVRVSDASCQPMAADDVAKAVADAALGSPVNDTIETAGPERVPLSELIARYLKATHDSREVVSDAEARYFGVRLDDRSLVPGDNPRLGTIRLEDWLRLPRAPQAAGAR